MIEEDYEIFRFSGSNYVLHDDYKALVDKLKLADEEIKIKDAALRIAQTYRVEDAKQITELKDALNEVCHDIRLHNPMYAHPMETIPKIEVNKGE